MESGADLKDASTGELVGALEGALLELVSRELPQTPQTVLELAERLGRVLDLGHGLLSLLAARVDATGAHRSLGRQSASAWLRDRLGMRKGRAQEVVTTGRQLTRLPRVAERLLSGGLPWGQATTIADALERVPSGEDVQVGERILLELVDSGALPDETARIGRVVKDRIDDHLGRPPEDARRGYERSWLRLSRSINGGAYLRGHLKPEDAAALEAALAPLLKSRTPEDDRDHAQRTADALIASVARGHRDAGLTVVIDLASYTARTGSPHPFGPSAEPSLHHTARLSPHPPPAHPPSAHPPSNQPPSSHSPSAHPPSSHPPSAHPSSLHPPSSHPPSAHPPSLHPPSAHPPSSHPPSPHPPSAHPSSLHPPSNQPLSAHLPSNQPPCVHPPSAEGTLSGSSVSPCPDDLFPDSAASWRVDSGMVRRRPAARLLDGTELPVEDARRIAIFAGISTLIVGRDGVPLYLGRRERLASRGQRRALEALYETCCVKGCAVPAALCEIHHLAGGWNAGTPTDIDLLAPACRWHNVFFAARPDQCRERRDSRGRAVIEIRAPWEPAPAPPPSPTPPGRTRTSGRYDGRRSEPPRGRSLHRYALTGTGTVPVPRP